MGDKIQFQLNRRPDKTPVLFRQGGHFHGGVWHIDRFPVADHRIPAGFADQHGAGLAADHQVHFPVVKENMLPRLNVICKPLIGNADHISRRRRIAADPDFLPLHDGTGFRQIAGTDVRTFRIDQDPDLIGNGADGLNDPLQFLHFHVCRVQPHHIHAVFVQTANKIRPAVQGGDGCNDLCPLHVYLRSLIHLFNFFLFHASAPSGPVSVPCWTTLPDPVKRARKKSAMILPCNWMASAW